MSEVNSDIKRIQELAEKGAWKDVHVCLQEFTGSLDTNLTITKAKALLKIERFEDAYSLLSELIIDHPRNVPIISLHHEALTALKGQLEARFHLKIIFYCINPIANLY